jgi:hypothetical protein
LPRLIIIDPILFSLGAYIIHLFNKTLVFAHSRFIPEFPFFDIFFESSGILKLLHQFGMHLNELEFEILDLVLTGISLA